MKYHWLKQVELLRDLVTNAFEKCDEITEVLQHESGFEENLLYDKLISIEEDLQEMIDNLDPEDM